MHLRNWWSQILQIWCRPAVWMWKSQPTDDKPSSQRRGQVMWPIKNCFGLQSYHWNGWI